MGQILSFVKDIFQQKGMGVYTASGNDSGILVRLPVRLPQSACRRRSIYSLVYPGILGVDLFYGRASGSF